MKHFIRMTDLEAGDLEHLLDLAASLKDRPHSRSELLAGEIVVLYFAKPSTRTRLSFAAAVRRLGAAAEIVGRDELQLGRGETIEDTARVISGYAKAFVIRTYDERDVDRFAAAADIPVINGLTDRHHPCQTLADLLTLRETFGDLGGLRVAFVGDSTNVAHSLMEGAVLAGMNVALAAPEGYGPDPEILDRVQELAVARSVGVVVTRDPLEAVAGASAVYTDVWVSMGDPPEERAERLEALGPYRVTSELMRKAGDGAVFLHCLPAHRGEEVTADVIDGAGSVVWRQAYNRLPTAQAVLVALTEKG